jgi:hypothetical protein
MLNLSSHNNSEINIKFIPQFNELTLADTQNEK